MSADPPTVAMLAALVQEHFFAQWCERFIPCVGEEQAAVRAACLLAGG